MCCGAKDIIAIIYQALTLCQVLTKHWAYLTSFNTENSLHFLHWGHWSLVRLSGFLLRQHRYEQDSPRFQKRDLIQRHVPGAPACVEWRSLPSPHPIPQWNIVFLRVVAAGHPLEHYLVCTMALNKTLCITGGKDNNIYLPLGIQLSLQSRTKFTESGSFKIPLKLLLDISVTYLLRGIRFSFSNWERTLIRIM